MLRPQRRWIGLLGVTLTIAFTGTGCSAILARHRINAAVDALNSAQSADAEKKAPYEYTLAALYLEKAREEEAYARFGEALDLSDIAAQYAEQAQSVANGHAKPGTFKPKP